MIDTKTIYSHLTKEEYKYLADYVFPYNFELQFQKDFLIFSSKIELFDFLYKNNQTDRQVLIDLLQRLDTMTIEHCFAEESILENLLNTDFTIGLPSGRWIFFTPSK